MARKLTLLEIWIEPKGVWAGIIRMLGYFPPRRKGLVPEGTQIRNGLLWTVTKRPKRMPK